MITGRVLQFDHERGYGFIAADDGGDDVFLHASVLDEDLGEPRPGMRLEFKVMAGDRGRKAFGVHVLPDDEPTAVPAPRLASAVPVPAAARLAPPEQVTVADAHDDDEPTCDVLSPEEFGQEVTELLLANVPALTGQQIIQVRASVLESANKHGWIES